MPETLLQTKLYIPALRPNLIARPGLIQRLNQGLQLGHKLTLISAPAGFGKTTLVAEWVKQKDEGRKLKAEVRNEETQPPSSIPQQLNVAWLSLDEGDADPDRFLTYVVAALQTLSVEIGQRAMALQQSPQPPPAESILTAVVNEISDRPETYILVLDDYHLILAGELNAPSEVDEAMAFLLEHQPPQLHLVIATREDPNLPLARLRARGQLTELRATDLRFSRAEAAEFFNQAMGLNLSAEDVAALENRTEGWIAGLQLAGLALQGSGRSPGDKVTAERIRSFTGSHRFVLDYLLAEVLEQQPQSIQTFLLTTAILDRLRGSLCDALTGLDNGQQTLEYLEQANLFIVPLDDERRWYRYHHLFADLMRQRLRQIHPEQIPKLHSRASEWFEQNDFPSAAIRHALAAEDFERVADLAELAWRVMDTSYKSVAWLNWVKALPDELVRARPLLSASYGWALLDSGEPEAAESRLQDAEQWLEGFAEANERPGTSSAEMVMLDEEAFRSLLVSLANARAYLSQALGDMPGTVKYAQRALDFLLEDDYFERGLSAILLGFVYWASGDLDAAHGAVTDAISNMQSAGSTLHMISFTSYLADIMTAQGRLNETVKTYLQLLDTVAEHGDPAPKETAVLHLGLSEIYLEQGDLEAARRHLERSDELGEQPKIPPWYRHWILAQTRIKTAEGNLDETVQMLIEAEHLYYKHPIPDIRPLTALIARAWLAQGRLTRALGWVRDRNLGIDDDLSYLCEFEHITLARIRIAQYKRGGADDFIREATELLDRLLIAAEAGGRVGSVIEILVQQALAYEAQGKIPAALRSLDRALILAEPEGYVRVFVDEGPPMQGLLTRVKAEGGTVTEHVRRLLAAFGQQEGVRPADITWDEPIATLHQPLIEPLSDRELEVLQLVAEGLTNREIAARLYLSLNTVKVHTRNIYGKLDAHNRTQAVAKARELEILSSST